MIKLFSDSRLGAEVIGKGNVCFTVWAPFAEAATVDVVSSPQRMVSLRAMEDGYHQGVGESIEAGARYFIRLHKPGPEGETTIERFADPASRYQPDGVHGPSQVVNKAFGWRDGQWSGIALSRYIIAEIHVGTFTPAGSFDGVIGELDRLKAAGFTALELMPVAQFPGNRNWGYDGVYPFAVQDSYGGPEGLKRLVNACHRAGLAVILDVVYNHLGPEGNYLRDFGPYFTDAYKTPWGDAVNFDGPDSDPVRRFFIENALQWVSEFRIDALRLDAVHAICDFSAKPFLQELGLAVCKAAETENRRIYCIAESALNDAKIVRSRDLGGIGLDAQWNDDFHHSLHVLLTGEKDGYYRDYGGIEDLAKAWREGFVYSGQYSDLRRRRFGNSSRNIPAGRFVVSAQNHDQIGNRMRGDRLSTLISFEQQKLAAAAVLLSPFIPLLFMGEEYGETAPFPYFVSHSDPELVAAVREGRRKEFESFGWNQEPPDPQSEAAFLQARPDPSKAESGEHRHLLAFHRELIRLRTEILSLSSLSKKSMKVDFTESSRMLRVHRWSLRDEVTIVFCFGAEDRKEEIHLPPGRWEKVIESCDARWGGPGGKVPDAVGSKEGGGGRILPAPTSAVLLYRATGPFREIPEIPRY
ncbi:MAG: malto-oligosyltrehalose trehalohydrolase [Desulfobacterales bacterium]|nr:malto-oligosyltrehalose trehalohydrolase [Desulfobacterales bacterium]